jgi:hypothetical protein
MVERLHSRGLAAGPCCQGHHPACRGRGAHAMRESGLPARWAARPRWARAGIALGGRLGQRNPRGEKGTGVGHVRREGVQSGPHKGGEG